MPTSDASSSPQGSPRAADGPGPGAVTFRMFASARAAAGAAEVHVAPGPTAEVVTTLAASLPPRFADVMAASSLVADGHRLDRLLVGTDRRGHDRRCPAPVRGRLR